MFTMRAEEEHGQYSIIKNSVVVIAVKFHDKVHKQCEMDAMKRIVTALNGMPQPEDAKH